MRYWVIIILGGLVLGPDLARAQGYVPARLLGFGGAQRALGTGNDAIYSNPAGLTAVKSYEIEAGYSDDLRGSDRRINASIADGKTGRVAGGLAFTYERFRPPEFFEGQRRLEGIRLDVATAIPLGQGMSLGGVGRYSDYRLLDGDEEIENGGDSGFSFDAGLQWAVGGGVSLAATIQNISDVEIPELPRAWGAGIGYRNNSLLFEVDVYHPWETQDPVYTGAAGIILAQKYSLRSGVSYFQGSDDVQIAFGAGAAFDRISIDAAYQQIIDPTRVGRDADDRRLVFSFRVRAF